MPSDAVELDAESCGGGKGGAAVRRGPWFCSHACGSISSNGDFSGIRASLALRNKKGSLRGSLLVRDFDEERWRAPGLAATDRSFSIGRARAKRHCTVSGDEALSYLHKRNPISS
jgi:hypothetical protein